MRAGPALLLALSASSLTGGCAALAVAGAAGATMLVVKDRTLGEGIDETTGGTEVRTKLLASDFGAFSGIAVELSQGRLLLAGDVPTMEHKIEAERIAWTVASVRQVENNLEVGPRSDVWRGGWDKWISAEIRTKFLTNDLIKAVNFNVETHRGVVYLMGIARAEPELQEAVEIARRVRGVERVVSYVELRNTEAQARAAALNAQLQTRLRPAPDLDLAPAPVAAKPKDTAAPVVDASRRLEVRYPDEADVRTVNAPPPMIETPPPGAMARRNGATTGISGFGRDWSTPRQGPQSTVGEPAALEPISAGSGAPLRLSQR